MRAYVCWSRRASFFMNEDREELLSEFLLQKDQIGEGMDEERYSVVFFSSSILLTSIPKTNRADKLRT